jgi:ATP-dependent DNA helicase RecG
MITRAIEREDAEKLCKREESHFFDAKALAVQAGKVARHVSAFANADGGELLIGLDDDGKTGKVGTDRWNGAATIEAFNGVFQALREIEPPCDVTATFLVCVGLPGYLLHLNVEKDSVVHKLPDGTVYQRKSAQSFPLDAQKIIDLAYAKGQQSYEDARVGTARMESIVESKELAAFLADYSPKTDPLDFTVNQFLVDVKTWEPTVSGLLLFSDNPSLVVPKQCAIRIARYETREEDPERDHLKETFTIEGPLYSQIKESVGLLQKIMSATPIWTMDGLKTLDYPPESVWEIVTNAVIHRDYSISDHVHIHVFDNRIEIRSPGKLPGYVTVENILDARYSRNPKIVRTLSRYKNPPNRDMGEGLNTAFQKMKEWKLKDPEIAVDGNYVIVTLPHTPLAAPEDTVLAFLKKNGSIKNKEARDLTGIRSENSMKNVFLRLQQQGLIEPVPGLKGSASRWQLKN